MEKKEMIDKLNRLLIEEFELEHDLSDSSQPLTEALDIDSLDTVDLVVLVEKHFGYKLTKKDLVSAKTMQDFYDLLYEHVASA